MATECTRCIKVRGLKRLKSICTLRTEYIHKLKNWSQISLMRKYRGIHTQLGTSLSLPGNNLAKRGFLQKNLPNNPNNFRSPRTSFLTFTDCQQPCLCSFQPILCSPSSYKRMTLRIASASPFPTIFWVCPQFQPSRSLASSFLPKTQLSTPQLTSKVLLCLLAKAIAVRDLFNTHQKKLTKHLSGRG